jgi:hypothetical protein
MPSPARAVPQKVSRRNCRLVVFSLLLSIIKTAPGLYCLFEITAVKYLTSIAETVAYTFTFAYEFAALGEEACRHCHDQA